MTIAILLQFVVVLAAIWMGARYSGVGLGLWGAVGLLVLVVGFGVTPTSPPIDVMLIILAVIMAASVMDAAGGIDFLVRVAEGIIRANPKYVTIVAPLTTWSFSFVAGTGHIVYPLLPAFLALSLGASPFAIGLIEGFAESVASILKLFSGYLSDRFGTRKLPVFLGEGFEALQAKGEYSEAFYSHGLAVEAAEATAEWLHRRIRAELGVPAGRGKRYSWGYGACPDLDDHDTVFRLLPADALGMLLTSARQLIPEQSTAALIVHHPEAKYYACLLYTSPSPRD